MRFRNHQLALVEAKRLARRVVVQEIEHRHDDGNVREVTGRLPHAEEPCLDELPNQWSFHRSSARFDVADGGKQRRLPLRDDVEAPPSQSGLAAAFWIA